MPTRNNKMVYENQELRQLADIGERIDFCMDTYHPYIMHDFCLAQLELITKIPISTLETYYHQCPHSFAQCLNEWRVSHAKNLMGKTKNLNLELKSIGSLCGFSSEKKFTKAFTRIVGLTPHKYQSQINNPIIP